MDEILSQLAMMAEKFKHNKKLSATDSKIGSQQLQILLQNPDYAGQACKLIPSLPTDPCCQAVLNAWQRSDKDHRERLVRLLLDEPALADTAGCYRKLALVAAFIAVDTRVALRLLIDLSCRLTRDGGKLPGRLLVSRFWKELMATKKLLGIPLGEYDVTAREISGIAAMVLLGMLESQEADTALKSEFVDWLGRCRSKVALGASVIAEAEKATKDWPEDLQRRCQSLGLIRTVSYRIAADRTSKPAFPESKVRATCTLASSESGGSTVMKTPLARHGESSGSVTGTREPKADPCAELNVQVCLDWLAQYVAALEKENASLKKKLNALDMEYYRERMRCVEQEKQLTDLREEQQRQETLIRDLCRQVTGLENENRELTNSLQEERLARQKEVESLKTRIDRECSYALEEFRNSLLDRLSGHYRGYLEAREKPPTSQLAEYLKFVFDRVFRELIHQGIRLDGDR